jgi:tRNA-modifying protein YgfZ
MKAALLPDRGVIRVSGEDARRFLNGLVTADVEKLTPEAPRFAALLTPQGKIIADFIVVEAPAEDGGGFLLDCPRALASTLKDRLTFYKLRAKVMIDDLSDTTAVMAIWGGSGKSEAALVYPDPRLPALGHRALLAPADAQHVATELGVQLVDATEYEAHRIALGVPRGGLDFIYNDAFPHETAMDQLGGVDFDKGCFIGQEVVSRMQHRGTARTRVMAVSSDGGMPEAGTPVTAADKPVGTMGSGHDGRGIAIMRLDRVQDALAAGTPLLAGGIEIRAVRPQWARYSLPANAAAE